MSSYWKSDAHRVVTAMKATGNQEGVVECWKNEVAAWALVNVGPDADAIKAWLPLWQTRPFYSSRELAPLWPMLVLAICGTVPRVPAANRLANELKFAGLPLIGKFIHPETGIEEEFFIVERLHFWRDRLLTQEEFENATA